MAAASVPPSKSASKSIQGRPRLTGKAIDFIYLHLVYKALSPELRQHVEEISSTKESTFLTGLLLCRLWELQMEDKVPAKYHDMIFASAKDDPIGCVEAYLREEGYDDPISDLIDISVVNGNIEFSPPPIDGWYRFEDLSPDEFNRFYPKLDPRMRYTDDDPSMWDELNITQYLGDRISNVFGDSPFNWEGIIWALVETERSVMEEVFNRNIDGWTDEKWDTDKYVYDDLDKHVKNLISTGGHITQWGGPQGLLNHIVHVPSPI